MQGPRLQGIQDKHPHAFSMIELIVAIVIIGITSAIAVPRYQNSLSRYRAERAAHTIAKDINSAHVKARTSSSGHFLIFSTSDNSYYVANSELDYKEGRSNSVMMSESPYNADLISVNFGGDQQLIIDGYGTPDSGGTVVVQAGTFQQTVTLDADKKVASVQ